MHTRAPWLGFTPLQVVIQLKSFWEVKGVMNTVGNGYLLGLFEMGNIFKMQNTAFNKREGKSSPIKEVNIAKLPPTGGALLQHLVRSTVQARVWDKGPITNDVNTFGHFSDPSPGLSTFLTNFY